MWWHWGENILGEVPGALTCFERKLLVTTGLDFPAALE